MNTIEKWLNSRIGLNFRSGLGRMKRAVQLLNQPQTFYPIIHVTGTNGKGSTIAFLQSLLTRQGKKVGTFTSPHMVSIHDRICINGWAIPDEDLVRIGKTVQAIEQKLGDSYNELSYFEILTLIALLYFKEQAVDVAVIEVGIGGLLDTTNVVTGDIAVVTSIGLDHQETLGGTLVEIAQQKAGIFKPHQLAVIGPLPKPAIQICEKEAKKKAVQLFIAGEDFSLLSGTRGLEFKNNSLHLTGLELGLLGKYQEENAGLALQTFWLFCNRQGWSVDLSQIAPALKSTRWWGRLEALSSHIYLDGAHNLPAIERLVDFIKEQKAQVFLLFGALKRKDYKEMLAYIEEALPDVKLTVTAFSYEQTLTKTEVGDLSYLSDYKTYIENFERNAQPFQLLFVTGSLYFIAEVRAWYLTQHEKKSTFPSDGVVE